MKLPSLRELVEFARELVGVLLFSLAGGWRMVACVPVNAAPHEGQSRLFSVTAAEQAGQVFIEAVSYRLNSDPVANFFRVQKTNKFHSLEPRIKKCDVGLNADTGAVWNWDRFSLRNFAVPLALLPQSTQRIRKAPQRKLHQYLINASPL
jgi:hypothetical protein